MVSLINFLSVRDQFQPATLTVESLTEIRKQERELLEHYHVLPELRTAMRRVQRKNDA
jgi:hypothetical protein